MDSKKDFLRLVYPQWQGGNIARWFPEFDPETISRGYFLGSQLLNFLCGPSKNTETVPVTVAPENRVETDGVLDKKIVMEQIRAALDILRIKNPERVLTLGGECSVSVPVFSFLAQKYADDVGIIWIDAHPDITLPGDPYNGFHAMALAACMGEGDSDILNLLPTSVKKENVLTVGVRNYERQQIVDRFQDWKLQNVLVSEVQAQTTRIADWLKARNLSRVLIHLDLDVMEPTELQVAVGQDPDGLRIKDTGFVVNQIKKQADIVGLTVAEPMPRKAIRLQQLLSELPFTSL